LALRDDLSVLLAVVSSLQHRAAAATFGLKGVDALP
jgi:hypothetical protein